jgi:hypothetical protein
MLLVIPFIETLGNQFRKHGVRLYYRNMTGLLDIPHLPVLWNQWKHGGGIEEDIVLRLVFMLLVGAGVILTVFLHTHSKLIFTGLTTLEQTIAMDAWKARIMERKMHHDHGTNKKSSSLPKPTQVVNPFDQGWRKNFVTTFGPNILYLFLPLPLPQPAPFVPTLKEKGT